MTADELHLWLIDFAIKDELAVLTRALVLSELDNIENAEKIEEQVVNLDWNRLLFAGSILAQSQKRQVIEAALRIATSAISLQTSTRIKDGGALLLQKLSNYQAIELAGVRGLLPKALDSRLGIASRVESLSRSLRHSILIEHSGQWLHVNKFQQQFWNKANEHAWVSASAPTASGKTYLVLQWLLDQITSSEIKVAVYLAPTRALVSEIEDSIATIIAKEELTDLVATSLPLSEKYNEARLNKRKVIYVLTQERLHFLINALNDKLFIDLLVADEAHKIGDRLRGVVLQDALERILRANSKAKFVFISPATQNPETLLDEAPVSVTTSPVDSDAPTVLQNLILTQQTPLKTTKWELKLRQTDNKHLDLGTITLPARPTTLKKKIALIAATIGVKGGTLVYANGAKEAEEIAQLISQIINDPNAKADQDLYNLADLAMRGVHEQYMLAALVRTGVAFHYGNMPSLLREEIERLFKNGKIKFLVCTSTLIEGVNLSCRTIVVRGPRKGKTQYMEAHDFWNLAGRAGRWGSEFQGNIVCIDPHNTSAWPSGVPERTRYPIRRETDVVLQDSQSLLSFIGSRWNIEVTALSQFSQYEQVTSYLLAHFMRDKSLKTAAFAKRQNPFFLKELALALAPLAERIEVPIEIVVRHPGVSAVGMQKLFEAFKSQGDEIAKSILSAPESDDAYQRMTEIMSLINTHLYPAFMPAGIIPLHTIVVLEWLRGLSLAAIIRARIRYNQKHRRPFDISNLIRGTMEIVEQVARFKAPKYLSAYMDVLRFYLNKVGKADLLQSNQLDVGVSLELGVSTRTLLSLLELGLSRMSAVAIAEKIIQDNLSRDDARNWLVTNDAQLESFQISPIILKEVRRKILGL